MKNKMRQLLRGMGWERVREGVYGKTQDNKQLRVSLKTTCVQWSIYEPKLKQWVTFRTMRYPSATRYPSAINNFRS